MVSLKPVKPMNLNLHEKKSATFVGLLVVTSLLTSCILIAQPLAKEYTYKKQVVSKKKVFELAGTDTLRFSAFETPPNQTTPVANVKYRNEELKVVFFKKKKLSLIQKANGSNAATILYNKKEFNDIVSADSNRYEWTKGKSKNDWKYSLNEREVMSCKLTKVKGKLVLQHTITDTSLSEIYLLEIASANFALARIHQRSSTPAIIGVAVGLALIRAATTPDNTPEIQ